MGAFRVPGTRYSIITSPDYLSVCDQGMAEESCMKCDAVIDIQGACSSLVYSPACSVISQGRDTAKS